MKALILSITMFSALNVMAKELGPFDYSFIKKVEEDNKAAEYNQNMKVVFLTKLLDRQQKSYEERLSYLETELRKTKDRLVEKSLNQEKLEDALNEKHALDTSDLKKELARTTKSLFEYQRQIEKMKPSDDLRNMIKLNTELASELRKSEDYIAIIQLKGAELMPGMHPSDAGARMPASVKPKK